MQAKVQLFIEIPIPQKGEKFGRGCIFPLSGDWRIFENAVLLQRKNKTSWKIQLPEIWKNTL